MSDMAQFPDLRSLVPQDTPTAGGSTAVRQAWG